MSVPLDSRPWDSPLHRRKITIITLGSSSGEREILMKHRVFTAASLSSWWVLHWVGPHCTSSLSSLCLPDFLDAEASLKYAVYIYIYIVYECVCVLVWETQHTVNDVWFENYKAPAASPPPCSLFQPSLEFFHTGCLGLRDPAVIRVFRTLLTEFALYPTAFQTQEHQALIEISLFLLKFCAETRLDPILHSACCAAEDSELSSFAST